MFVLRRRGAAEAAHRPSLHMNITRAVHVATTVFSVIFVGASAAQIIPAVFGIGIEPLPSTPAASPESECADGVRSLALALDRATEAAWSPRTAHAVTMGGTDHALEAFRAGLVPEWNAAASVEKACGTAREGWEAWAALLRLRRAEEQVALRGLVELVPLRRDVAAHLPANLR
jgi:hypothetical protein